MKKLLGNDLKNCIQFLPFLIVFIGALWFPIDTDLGWHLKYGEHFLTHKEVLRDNIFATEMPEYKYVNSAWGTDVITYAVFKTTGFFGLSVLGALLVAATFYFFARASNITLWETSLLAPLILYLQMPVIINSFRGQFFSLLGLGILYYILRVFEKKIKAVLLTIPLFLLWVNVHGQFIVGFGLFTVWVVYYLTRHYFTHKKKVSFDRYYVYCAWVGSGIATLINPFGILIYTEILRHFDNPLKITIVEWGGVPYLSTFWWQLIGVAVCIAISIILFLRQKKLLQNIFFIIVAIIFLVASLDSRRYMWPLFFLSIPVVSVMLERIRPKNTKILYTIATIACILSYTYFGFIKFPKESLLSFNWNQYCFQIRCTPHSAEFLQKNKFQGLLFSNYEWGGWLIWNYPNIKPNIDGRMAFWEDEQGYNALAKYYKLENNLADIHTSKYDIVYIPASKPLFQRMIVLAQEKKWDLVYQDGFSFIFVRNKSTTANLP